MQSDNNRVMHRILLRQHAFFLHLAQKRRRRHKAQRERQTRTRVLGRLGNMRRKRMSWPQRLKQLNSAEFRRRYRLSKRQFAFLAFKLHALLKPKRADGLSVNLQLSISLRMLAGGSYLDVADLHGVKDTTVHVILRRVVNAIDKVLFLPWEKEGAWEANELHNLAAGFARHTGGVCWGTVGSIDVIHIKIRRPSENGGLYMSRKGFHRCGWGWARRG